MLGILGDGMPSIFRPSVLAPLERMPMHSMKDTIQEGTLTGWKADTEERQEIADAKEQAEKNGVQTPEFEGTQLTTLLEIVGAKNIPAPSAKQESQVTSNSMCM